MLITGYVLCPTVMPTRQQASARRSGPWERGHPARRMPALPG